MYRERIGIALSWLEGQRFAMQRLLERLVRQTSFTFEPSTVNALVAMIDQELRRIGLKTERIRSPSFGDHLYFQSSGRGAPAFLIGHTDTIHPRSEFSTFELLGDQVRGPGALEMKGGLVVGLFALEALSRAALLPHIPVRGLFASDEEAGSPDSQKHLQERAVGSVCALGLKPGLMGDAIILERKGVAVIRARATGVAAHSGIDHERGGNAIWTLARFVDRVQAITDPTRGATVNVGFFHGGTSSSMVPAAAVAEIDLRYATIDDGASLYRLLDEAARNCAVEGTSVELTVTSWRAPMTRTDASTALAHDYAKCQKESGLGVGEAPLLGTGSDACTTSALGIPSIDGLGPRGSGYHTTDERVDLTTLVPKASALVRFLGRKTL